MMVLIAHELSRHFLFCRCSHTHAPRAGFTFHDDDAGGGVRLVLIIANKADISPADAQFALWDVSTGKATNGAGSSAAVREGALAALCETYNDADRRGDHIAAIYREAEAATQQQQPQQQQGQPAKDDAAAGDRVAVYRKKLAAFYSRHNPAKTADEIAQTVEAYIVQGGEPGAPGTGAEQLDAQLRGTYGVGLEGDAGAARRLGGRARRASIRAAPQTEEDRWRAKRAKAREKADKKERRRSEKVAAMKAKAEARLEKRYSAKLEKKAKRAEKEARAAREDARRVSRKAFKERRKEAEAAVADAAAAARAARDAAGEAVAQGYRDALTLYYARGHNPDKTDADIADTVARRSFAEHSPKLQALLHVMNAAAFRRSCTLLLDTHLVVSSTSSCSVVRSHIRTFAQDTYITRAATAASGAAQLDASLLAAYGEPLGAVPAAAEARAGADAAAEAEAGARAALAALLEGRAQEEAGEQRREEEAAAAAMQAAAVNGNGVANGNGHRAGPETPEGHASGTFTFASNQDHEEKAKEGGGAEAAGEEKDAEPPSAEALAYRAKLASFYAVHKPGKTAREVNDTVRYYIEQGGDAGAAATGAQQLNAQLFAQHVHNSRNTS